MLMMMIILAAAAIITIAVAQIDPLCLPAPTSGNEDFYCNSQNLPSEAAYLQLTALATTRFYFIASFPVSHYCGWHTYGDHYDASIKLNSYASCSMGSSHQKECERCLSFASEMIKARCPGTSGAQVGSDLCCIRYEEYGFC
ncbi:unnamed protein product [Linum trigynum]|uniref:Gnk2-homologous domain-containing protein n=1 Tax=Linum trigynum TaxID=586398 RepID=A0AAV2EZD2_9ROSI